MYGYSFIAVDKPKDGKPYTVAMVGTSLIMQIALCKNKKALEKGLIDLYGQFQNGKDKSEKGATLEEIEKLEADGVDILTKEGKLIRIKK